MTTRSALRREDVFWPGNAAAVIHALRELHSTWRAHLTSLDDAALRLTDRTRWPFQDKPFGDVVAWLNVELTKSAAELGYARFLYAACAQRRD